VAHQRAPPNAGMPRPISRPEHGRYTSID